MREEESAFIYEHAKDDDCYDYTRVEDIPEFSEYTLIVTDDGQTKPWYCNTLIMGTLDILMLGWIQRLVLYYKATPAMLKLTKVIKS